MNTQHTPEQWTVFIDYRRCSYTVFNEHGNFMDMDYESVERRGKIIAAAPDLLESLKFLADEALRLGNHLSSKGQGATALGLAELKARKAIAKAEGR